MYLFICVLSLIQSFFNDGETIEYFYLFNGMIFKKTLFMRGIIFYITGGLGEMTRMSFSLTVSPGFERRP